jgi:tRNA A37 N6-isopentenylltransferase MiaA
MELSLAQYQSLARHKIREIQERGKLPFLVGGTGLYIQAVVYPFEFPDTEGYQVIRNDLRRMWGDGKQEEIYQKLKDIDPASAERIDPHDFRRISRALEVYYLTGRPISSYQRDNKNPLYPMEMHSKVHTYWTQKGRLFIYELHNVKVFHFFFRKLYIYFVYNQLRQLQVICPFHANSDIRY